MSASPQKSVPRQAVILFSDIIHSSVFSDTLGLVDYDMFLEEFQKTMYDAKKRVFELTRANENHMEFDIRGDEACVILYTDDTSNNLYTALMMASYMKSLWFQSSFNMQRVSEAKIASDIAIGIHTGKVIVRTRVSKKMPPKPEGYAINLAKRIEGLSREGAHTKMMISNEVRILLKQFNIDIEITRRITKQFRGILYPIHVYEIVNFPVNFYRSDAYNAKTSRR
jgi:class 3 adenylate cyclase